MLHAEGFGVNPATFTVPMMVLGILGSLKFTWDIWSSNDTYKNRQFAPTGPDATTVFPLWLRNTRSSLTLKPVLEAVRDRFKRLGIRQDIFRGRYKPIVTADTGFANIGTNKRLNRFSLRGKNKVQAQWCLYCMVHNIEKVMRHGEMAKQAA